jgi:hypothetical protein
MDLTLFLWLAGITQRINVLHRSPLFTKLSHGEPPTCNYKVNDHDYTMGYYLADGSYPAWAVFVKNIGEHIRSSFRQSSRSMPEDIERAFGVLQARFAKVHGLVGTKNTLRNIMTYCVILHNIIIEDERGLDLEFFYDNVGTHVQPQRNPDHIHAFLETHRKIEDASTHEQLRKDLIEHQWMLKGNK